MRQSKKREKKMTISRQVNIVIGALDTLRMNLKCDDISVKVYEDYQRKVYQKLETYRSIMLF